MSSVLKPRPSEPNKRLAGFGNPPFDPPRTSASSGFDDKRKKRCKYCTRLIDANSKFCMYCGKEVDDNIEKLIGKYLGDAAKKLMEDNLKHLK